MKKIIFTLIILLSVISNSNGLFRSSEAGRYYFWMFSPDLLSRGVGVGGTANPSGIIINPASNAFVQRLRFEVSYGLSPAFWVRLNIDKYSDININNNIYGNKTNNINDNDFSTIGDFFLPFIVNFGVVIPSRYGNFTIYANYMNMSNRSFSSGNNNDLSIGKVGSIYLSFSKDYNDNFAFGFSGNFKFSYNPDSKYTANKFDVGGGFDFGFIFRPDWFVAFNKKKAPRWGFQDFEFAITIKEIAKPLINNLNGPNGDNDIYWFANPFTPAVGMSFNLFNDGLTHWKWLLDIGFPFFQNTTLSLGTEIQIYKFIVLRGAYTLDIEGLLEYTGAIDLYEYMYNIVNVNFGLSFKFRSDFFNKQTKEEAYQNRHKNTEFSIDLGAKPFHDGFIFELGCTITIGTRDVTPPEVSYIQRDYFISPNFDGVQDNLVIDLNIKDERYVKYWKFEVANRDGKVVRTIESKEQREETMTFKDVLKKYFSPKTGILIPKTILWDGKNDGGQIVEDGTYSFKFYAMDDNKNMEPAGSREGNIVVKTDKPLIEHKVENVIFSPNDDSVKDTLIIDIDIIRNNVEELFFEIEELKKDEIEIKQYIVDEIKLPHTINNEATSDKVQLWFVDIVGASGDVVRTYQFDKKGKQKIEWDGKDGKGNLMPDGVYKVKLHSVDLAGNYWEDFITNIIINTEPTPIEIKLLSNIFSPNNDTVKDTIGFTIDIPNKNGIEKWNFDILDSNNKTVKTFDGVGIPPKQIEWDGKDSGTKISPEGKYRGELLVTYINGNMPKSKTPEFVLDITPPSANVKFSTNIFSPDGDGVKDVVEITKTTSYEDEWRGEFYDSNKKLVKSFIWKGEPPKKFFWDGVDNKNQLLNDGKYSYVLKSTDLAGNYYETEKIEVEVFTKETPVFITASHSHFSPNGDNVKDNQNLQIRSSISESNKVTNWELLLKDDKDMTVFTEKKSGNLPNNFVWNGKNSNQNVCIDGDYYAVLNVNFQSGTSSSSKTKLFTIDNIAPSIEIKSITDVLSPNGDGYMDTIEILQRGSHEDLWEVLIFDKDKKEVWKKFYNGRPSEKEIWGGLDLNNNNLPNGFYNYSIKATDKAGNVGFAEVKNIELKNIRTTLFLTLDDNKFSPNDDGKFDTIVLKSFVGVKDDLEVYKLDIIDKEQKVIKTFEGKTTIPEKIIWDGLDNNGKVSSDGVYSAKLYAIYRFGNRPIVESAQFSLDNTPPEISVATSPEFFSPDNDGADDELTMSIKSYDFTGIKDWKIAIMNPANTKPFVVYSGVGKPTDSIIWNGVGDNGELVESAEDYPAKIYAVDIVGNILESELSSIMVDILVEKLEDGRLKIKISNIEFKANSAEMTESPKNTKIIELLSKALKKYNMYNITIEGHANKFIRGWFNEDIARKLSKDRAEFISAGLVKKGIAVRRLTTEGKGGDMPVYIPPEDTTTLSKEEQEEIQEKIGKNRRVEFYLDKN